MTYFYRFLRSEDDGQLKSELTGHITFYTQDQCSINPQTRNLIDWDFTRNPPVCSMVSEGITPQLLFGVTDQIGCLGVFDYFGQQKRVLSRFAINSETLVANSAQLMIDQQVQRGSGISKYLLAPFFGQHLQIPDEEVDVLSLAGWVPKPSARQIFNYDIKAIHEADYISLIKRFVT